MDTAQVIARFEAERSALRGMDHPNIAKVLDAGTTNSGRPYFVMELVKGVPITDYCDRNRLVYRASESSCLSPLRQLTRASKGHHRRDIKPSNVLVSVLDGKPVPQGDRFWRGQGDRPTAHGKDDVHATRRGRRHPWNT